MRLASSLMGVVARVHLSDVHLRGLAIPDNASSNHWYVSSHEAIVSDISSEYSCIYRGKICVSISVRPSFPQPTRSAISSEFGEPRFTAPYSSLELHGFSTEHSIPEQHLHSISGVERGNVTTPHLLFKHRPTLPTELPTLRDAPYMPEFAAHRTHRPRQPLSIPSTPENVWNPPVGRATALSLLTYQRTGPQIGELTSMPSSRSLEFLPRSLPPGPIRTQSQVRHVSPYVTRAAVPFERRSTRPTVKNPRRTKPPEPYFSYATMLADIINHQHERRMTSGYL